MGNSITVDYIWEVNGHDGQPVIWCELEVDIDCAPNSDGVPFIIDEIKGPTGARLSHDDPLFGFLSKHLAQCKKFEALVDSQYEWETDGETGYSHSPRAA